MERMKIEILGLSEIHWRDVGEFSTSIPTEPNQYHVIYSGGRKCHQGVAFIVTEKAKKAILYHHTVNERVILVKVKEKNNDILIIKIYGYPEDPDTEKVDEFYELLEGTVKEHKKSTDKLIVTGDFNARVGNRKCSYVVGNFGLEQRTTNGDRLIEFCKKHQLEITSTWSELKKNATCT